MPVQRNTVYFVHLIIQSLAAATFMFFLLYSLNKVLANEFIWAVGASTLASTAYIVFGTPHIPSAKPYRILGGYLIAILCGYALQHGAVHVCDTSNLCINLQHQHHVLEFAAAISVGISFLLMFLLRCYHPPAAGLAVVMVLDIHNPKALMVIGGALVVLILVRWLFAKHLRPLI